MNAILVYAAQMLLTDQFDDVAFLSDLRATMKRYFHLEQEQTLFYYDEQKHVFFEQAGWLLEEVTARAIDEKKQEERYQVFYNHYIFEERVVIIRNNIFPFENK